MPANTPNRGYTYATYDDANDLALITQRIAEQLDTDVQGVDDRVTTAITGHFSVPLTAPTTTAAAETLTPLTVTFTAEAGKTYAIVTTARIYGSAVDLRSGMRVRRGTTLASPLIGEAIAVIGVAGVGVTTEYTCFDTPGAGPVTYTIWTLTMGGTGNTRIDATAAAPATLWVRQA